MHLHEIQEKLRELPQVPGRKHAVIISTGSYCPVHIGHLQNFDIAAKFLSEKHGIDTLAGYISPSCDSYVSKKFGSDSILFLHRYEMVKLACYEHNAQKNIINIFPDPWEGLQPSFVSFHKVRDHFDEVLKKLFPKEKIIVLYIAGSEQFNKSKLYDCDNFIGISRPDCPVKGNSRPEKNIYVCNDPEYCNSFSDTSSNNLIDRIKKNQSLKGITFDSVISYIKDEL